MRASVVIPVYNNPDGLEICLESVLNQSVDRDEYEVIVVDNNSTDGTPEVAKTYPVTLVYERDIQSSYAARNRGIAESSGNILAFIDSDCEANHHWLEAGLSPIETGEASLVTGPVTPVPEHPEERSPAQLYDSILHLQMERDAERGCAPTANLFCAQYVFDDVGRFESTQISGQDVMWTKRATDANYDIVFSETASVRHPTRTFNQLLNKRFRIGRGAAQRDDTLFTYAFFRGFLPYRGYDLKQRCQDNNVELTRSRMTMLYVISWCVNLSWVAGKFWEHLFSTRQHKTVERAR